MSQLAWACKCAMAAFDVRRKARAWRQWRQMQVRTLTLFFSPFIPFSTGIPGTCTTRYIMFSRSLLHSISPLRFFVPSFFPLFPSPLLPLFPAFVRQGLVDRERALVGRVLLAGADRRREGMLRGGLKRWKEGCERVRAEEELLQTRAARLRSVAVFLGAARSPRAEVSRAFRTWVQAAETVQVCGLGCNDRGGGVFLGGERRRVGGVVVIAVTAVVLLLLLLKTPCISRRVLIESSLRGVRCRSRRFSRP